MTTRRAFLAAIAGAAVAPHARAAPMAHVSEIAFWPGDHFLVFYTDEFLAAIPSAIPIPELAGKLTWIRDHAYQGYWVRPAIMRILFGLRHVPPQVISLGLFEPTTENQ